MSYYIGPQNGGYLAEAKNGSTNDVEEFKHFHDAVKWAEQLQRDEFKKNEAERNQENT